MNDTAKKELRYKNLRPGDLVVKCSSARLVVAVVLCEDLNAITVDVTWLPVWGDKYGHQLYTLGYARDNRVLDSIQDDIVRADEATLVS